MKRHGNLFNKIVSYDNLYLAYTKASKNKSTYREIKEFKKNVENNLKDIQTSLINKTFTTGKYRTKTLYEPKKRTSYILPFSPDRVVQHALMQVLIPILEPMFYEHSYACVKGRGPHKGSVRTTACVKRNKYVLKCDVKSFYCSVVHEILKKQIRRKVKCNDTLWLIDNIIDSYPNGRNVPIGNYTSQWFGNFYLTPLDYYIKQVLKVKDYIRYCDDFVLFSDDKKQLQQYKDQIISFCKNNLDLILSKKEIFPVARGVDYLGYRHFKHYKLVRKSTAKRTIKRIKAISLNAKKRLLIKFRGQVASAKGVFKHANSYNLQRYLNIDSIHKRLVIKLHCAS